MDVFTSPIKSPVVGIFVNSKQIEYLHSQNTNTRISAIISAARLSNITLYFFSLNEVDLETRRISGTYYNEITGLWSKKLFPYPDVLYARGGSIKQREKYNIFNQQLKKKGIKKINSGPIFNKWDVLQILEKNSKLAPHLPATILYASAEDLKLMLDKYGEVYLKACRGRKGMQVIRIKKMYSDYFEFRYFRKYKLNKGFVNFFNLMHVINNFFPRKPFLIQQAIDLPRINASIYDMRAEAQRNGKGELEIIEILVRVGQPGVPITQHASSYLFDYFFSKITGYPAVQITTIKNSINEFLTNIYLSIEDAYGPYGEIGIDFAFDKKGHLWFIECNSRSTKVSLFKAAGEEARLRSYLNPFGYAKFLHNKGKQNQ